MKEEKKVLHAGWFPRTIWLWVIRYLPGWGDLTTGKEKKWVLPLVQGEGGAHAAVLRIWLDNWAFRGLLPEIPDGGPEESVILLLNQGEIISERIRGQRYQDHCEGMEYYHRRRRRQPPRDRKRSEMGRRGRGSWWISWGSWGWREEG